MTSFDIKRILTHAAYWLFGLFTIPFILYHYNLSYTFTITVLHIMLVLLLMFTLHQHRKLDKVCDAFFITWISRKMTESLFSRKNHQCAGKRKCPTVILETGQIIHASH